MSDVSWILTLMEQKKHQERQTQQTGIDIYCQMLHFKINQDIERKKK